MTLMIKMLTMTMVEDDVDDNNVDDDDVTVEDDVDDIYLLHTT